MNKTVLYTEKSSVSGAAITVVYPSGEMCSIPINNRITIGRASNDSSCDVQISSSVVSRVHGEIFFANGEVYYRDLDSTNGTYINNTLYGRNCPKQTCKISNGDVISVEVRQAKNRHPDFVYCIVTFGSDLPSKFSEISLSESIAELQIGRKDESGLKLSNPMISQKHASFFYTHNGWAIIDHKSTNGVYLNGKRISTPKYLNLYDVVRVIDTVFVFCANKLICISNEDIYEDREASRQRYVVHQDNAMPKSYSQKSGAHLVINIVERSVAQRFRKLMLLQNINVSVSNGEMVLILGGSGAGKTTFINAVMGYEKASGKILYNDTDIYEEYERMKYEIGFVPQQDLLRLSDTVYDTLANAAEMKLPRSIKDDVREQKILDILNRFGLSREKESLVSKLSGGQKKRLSIAVEFIADPSLFFLDEPDSGIDDVMGRGLMETLREIADMGKIIMVITHSPERAADLFDKVIVLAKSEQDNCGHLAFFGSVSQAFEFFGVSSFREIVKKINRTDENGEGLSDYFIEKYRLVQEGKSNE